MTLSPTPTIRPADVSPDSPYRLSKGAQFIVGGPAESGEGIVILDQFRSQERAEDARKRRLWNSAVRGRPRVYRVERSETR